MNPRFPHPGQVPAKSHSPALNARVDAVSGANAGGRHEVISHLSALFGAGPFSNLPGSNPDLQISLGQSLAAVILWDSGRFDTHDIAKVLMISEAAVERVLHITREERRRRLLAAAATQS